MKKVLLGVFVVSSLFAKTNVSLSVGSNNFDTKESVDNTTVYGIRGDFYLDNLYHIDLGYDNLGTVGSTKIQRVSTQFSADGEEEYHVVPYMGLGLGYEKVGDETDELKSQPYISAGIGFRYNISNNFNFLLDAKALWKTSTRNINYTTGVGVGYMIGSQPVNNQILPSQEIVIPQKKLDIKPVTIASTFSSPAPIVIDTKQCAVVAPTRVLPQPISQIRQTPVIVQPSVNNMVVSNKGTYIQVAAYTKYQPRALLSKLSRSGHRIIIRKTRSGKKALIGPYKSRSEAVNALLKIKKITRGAFIYKG